MAVYTEVAEESLSAFLRLYALGPAINFQGIEEGIENSNYFLETGKGKYVLTLFEKRAPTRDLPFFMDLMRTLGKTGFPCPKPVVRMDGAILGPLEGRTAAILTWLQGTANMTPGPEHCFNAASLAAEMHGALKNFRGKRENPLDLHGLKTIYEKTKGPMAGKLGALEPLARNEIKYQNQFDFSDLPQGIIHADLFPDNVFFQSGEATGIIDFYFSATGPLALDLAIMVNSWCFRPNEQFLPENFRALLGGYESKRPLEENEKTAFPELLRLGALRFLLTRAEDWLGPERGVLGIVKDPNEYGKILSFHRERSHIEDYGQS